MKDISGAQSLFFSKDRVPPGCPSSEKIRWFSINDIAARNNYKKQAVFIEDIKDNSSLLLEGKLQNSWFLGGLGLTKLYNKLFYVAELEEQLFSQFNHGSRHRPTQEERLKKELHSGVWAKIFHHFETFGIYVIKFHKDFKTKYVIIDDRLPCVQRTLSSRKIELIFSQCAKPNEFWIPLIEKAYAKLCGCYEALIGGHLSDSI
jgi:calpain, invertebrate